MKKYLLLIIGMLSTCLAWTQGNLMDNVEWQIEPTSEFDYIADFSEDVAFIRKGNINTGKWGFIDKSGKIIIPCIYNGASGFLEGLSYAKKYQKWGYIDKTGKEVIPFIYDNCGQFFEGLASVRKGGWKYGKCGYIDKTGKEIIPFIYDNAASFSEGLAYVKKMENGAI